MAGLGLRQLVPPSLLAGRWLAVLVCYLDDSGTDPQSSIVTLGGYVAPDDQWAQFERAVEPIFAKYGVEVFHAVDLEKSDGVFAGWSILKKQSFVAQICSAMVPHVPLGVSMSALKTMYQTRAAESGRKRTVTPFTFCANGLVDWMMTDVRLDGAARAEGFAFIFEAGSLHNAEALQHLNSLRELYPDLAAALKSIIFVSKTNCRAIQMADLFAYYSRRHGDAMAKAPASERVRMAESPPTMLKIITERVPHRAFVANDFGPEAPGSRFFAGDPPSEGQSP